MLYYLTVTVNGERQNSILLNNLPAYSSRRITIGRADDNDVVLPYAAVSRHHAVVEFIGSNMEIIDAGSLNKLRVNGKAYERIRVSNGMKVVIGSADNNVTLQITTVDEVADSPKAAPQDNPAPSPAPAAKPKPKPVPVPSDEMPETFGKSCIGFRIFAFLTDSMICALMGLGSAIIMLLLLNQVISGIKVIILLTVLIAALIIWLYFALGDSGSSKGTMGKIALGLWVIDIETGGRISFGKASTRFFAKILSTLILFIGYFPIFGKKQTLHDYIAGTAVVKNPRTIEK